MKTQPCEPTDVLDLVPQVLHLKKVLVPIDFSKASKKAIQYAVRFADQFNCEIDLIHVIEPTTAMFGAPLAIEVSPNAEDEFLAAEKDLTTLARESCTDGVKPVHSLIRVGHAPNEITKAAKELDIDVIIIATHGDTSWRHLCIGSTAERVVRTAPCPVLVVREKEHEFV